MAAARHRNLRQARAEWRPPRLYRVRARLPGRRALYRRCRRPARLCEGRRALCARPARRHLARQHTGGWHAAGGSGADAGLYGGAGRYGLGRPRAQPPRLADAALPSQLHDRLRAVLAAQPLLPLVVGQGVRRAARHLVAPAAGLRCCERLDRRQAHRFDPHRDPAGILPAPKMGRDRQMTAFAIPTVETARLRLRAFHAADLDAYSAMQANPEVMRYLLTGQTASRVQTWYTMLTSLGSWALRGYGMWACDEIAAGRFIGSVGIFEPLDRRSRRSPIRSTSPSGTGALRPRRPARRATGCSRNSRSLARAASSGPRTAPRSASPSASAPFSKAPPNCAASPSSIGCITAPPHEFTMRR